MFVSSCFRGSCVGAVSLESTFQWQLCWCFEFGEYVTHTFLHQERATWLDCQGMFHGCSRVYDYSYVASSNRLLSTDIIVNYVLCFLFAGETMVV